MMELVPVDADLDEAEHVAHADGPQWQLRAEDGVVRHLESRRQDGDDAVAGGYMPPMRGADAANALGGRAPAPLQPHAASLDAADQGLVQPVLDTVQAE